MNVGDEETVARWVCPGGQRATVAIHHRTSADTYTSHGHGVTDWHFTKSDIGYVTIESRAMSPGEQQFEEMVRCPRCGFEILLRITQISVIELDRDALSEHELRQVRKRLLREFAYPSAIEEAMAVCVFTISALAILLAFEQYLISAIIALFSVTGTLIYQRWMEHKQGGKFPASIVTATGVSPGELGYGDSRSVFVVRDVEFSEDSPTDASYIVPSTAGSENPLWYSAHVCLAFPLEMSELSYGISRRSG